MRKKKCCKLIGYRLRQFCSVGYCLLTIFVGMSCVYLIFYAFELSLFAEFSDNFCNSINSVLLSISTGYIVSYILYVFTVHVPNFRQNIASERIMCHYLSNYRDELFLCFGGLYYKLKKENSLEVIKIPDIMRIFSSKEMKDEFLVKIINATYDIENNYLVTDFERLKHTFEQIVMINALYKSRFSDDINYLLMNNWAALLYSIKDELQNNRLNFEMLQDKDCELLISKNFQMVEISSKIGDLLCASIKQ